MRNIILAALICVACILNPGQRAYADTLTWSWQAPTARTDGSAFDMATEGAGYHVWFNGEPALNMNGEPLLLSVGANNLSRAFPTGQVCAEFTTVDRDGRETPFRSDPVCKSVLAPPGVPSSISVIITVTPP